MNKNKIFALSILVAFFFVGLQVSSDAAKAKAKNKVIEGGQNQLVGTEGKIGDWLFNGTSKLKVSSVSYPKEGTPGYKLDAGKKLIAIELEVKNAHKFTGSYGGVNCKLQLVDQDDQLFEAVYQVNRLDWKKRESPRRLLPAAGLKALYVAAIPEEFVPVRLIYFVEPGVPLYRVSLESK
jgi:hypothetical protein